MKTKERERGRGKGSYFNQIEVNPFQKQSKIRNSFSAFTLEITDTDLQVRLLCFVIILNMLLHNVKMLLCNANYLLRIIGGGKCSPNLNGIGSC